jgi:uncharacterized protein YkwD
MVNEDRPARAGGKDRNRRRALGVTIGVGALTVPISLPPQGCAGSGPPPEPPAVTAEASPDPQTVARLYARDVLNLVNQQRKAHGCHPLVVNTAISKAALEHSRDMGVRGYFAHDTPSGVTPWTRMEQAGYAEPAAENIAVGYQTPQKAVDGWMGSAAHRANILDCSYKSTGIGYYDGASAKSSITDTPVSNPSTNRSKSAPAGPWWTEDFGYA